MTTGLLDARGVSPRNVAVILAGGTGTRLGLEIPKQLINVAGQSSLEHSVAIFEAAPDIDDIIVMLEAASYTMAADLLAKRHYKKITKLLVGGETRNETSQLALIEIEHVDSKVIFHDAVRPLLDQRIISDCISALDNYDAVDTAIPSADTIIEVDDEGLIRSIPNRSALRRGQTPQGFKKHVIDAAYEAARADPQFEATDDCSVVLKYQPDVPIFVVEGSEANIKITHPVDLHLADKLFQIKGHQLGDGAASVSHLTGQSVVVFGGSSGIGRELVTQLGGLGANVKSFSRGETGTDVQNRANISAALEAAHNEFGKIDHVVLTAGVLDVGPLVAMTDRQLDTSLTTNLTAAFVVAQESYPYLVASQGSILLFTSSSYTRGRANYSVYSSTKAAIVNLTQALADEWRTDLIRVNCVNPTRTATAMRTRAFGEEDRNTLLSGEQVAWASAQVLGSAMTGQVFDVRLPETDPAPTLHSASNGA